MTLRFVRRETFHSLYRTASGKIVTRDHGILTRFDFDQDTLDHLWSRYCALSPRSSRPTFDSYLRPFLVEPDDADDVVTCSDCSQPFDSNTAGLYTVRSYDRICQSCADEYASCGDCGEMIHQDDASYTLHDESVCDHCRDRRYSFCEECDGYYHDDYSGEHQHDDGCDCEAPHQSFTMRGVGNDVRTTLSLPAGTLTDEGVGAIARAIRIVADGMTAPDRQDERGHLWTLSYDVTAVGQECVTRQGTLPKRLSRYAYKKYGIKLSADLMSAIGNHAAAHSRGADLHLEVTRNLNLSAEDFYHEDSCWWQSYAYSRCSLKTNGGIGLRTFYGPDSDRVTGRAWVQPLTLLDGNLVATHDADTADAYVVYNGYGALQGYTAARAVATMAGLTYTKISFGAGNQYVNGSTAYLVASEDVVKRTERLHLDLEDHASQYAY